MAVVFCTKCGKQVPDNATSCPSCGHARTGITALPASPPPQRLAPANISAGHETPGFFKILLDTSFNDFHNAEAHQIFLHLRLHHFRDRCVYWRAYCRVGIRPGLSD